MGAPLSTAMNTGDWVDAALHAVQIAAILIGASWAYYKFFRGRIFHRRAEVTLEASLLELASSHAIRIKAALKNTGSADIPLLVNALKVFSFRNGDVDDEGHQQWRKFVTLPVFENHRLIESQETISDEALVTVGEDPDKSVVGYRVSCEVIGEYESRFIRGKKPGGIRWTTNVVIPAHQVVSTGQQMDTGGKEVKRCRLIRRMWTTTRSVV
jgi:hypothetical protein